MCHLAFAIRGFVILLVWGLCPRYEGGRVVILECDVCGTTFKKRGIFTNVVNQIKVGGQREIQGFEELIPQLQTNEVSDVCSTCMDKLIHKQKELAAVKTDGIFIDLKEYIRGGLNG